MEKYRKETKRIYEINAESYECKTKHYLKDYLIGDAKLFADNLSGGNILDIGCGPGRDMIFFDGMGLNVYGIDISNSMCRLSRSKGLRVVLGDLENLPFREGHFNGVWAYTSLLHMPKDNFSIALDNIAGILGDNGIFYIGMKEGNFEGWKEGKTIKGEKRFYSLYKDGEMRNLLSRNFKILHFKGVDLGEDKYLNYLCRKN
ncbi:MAG: class I SAM-dependent methyltransferase [Nanoarchaeota archaeon]|nr:class I SAM-dependent methyltransferase [Nanoarchaeota archaeon]